jgi:hypothetical protein
MDNVDVALSGLVGSFSREFRKNLLFFGGFGSFVALLMVFRAHLRDLGLASGEPWPDLLFSSFVSFDVYGLVFFTLIVLGVSSSILAKFGVNWLVNTVVHVELGLIQLASTIISFTCGLGVVALLHAAYTRTGGGFALAGWLIVFDLLLFSMLLISGVVVRRIQPFHYSLWASFVMLTSLVLVGWLLIRGGA